MRSARNTLTRSRFDSMKKYTINVPQPSALLDMSLMPFGKYVGLEMQEVPASYLHWLWINGKREDMRCPVAGYIRENLKALMQEHPDGIWD